jgi:hypothetical protein
MYLFKSGGNTMIQRYDLIRTDDRYDDMEMIESKNGKWVRHSDVLDLISAVQVNTTEQETLHFPQDFNARSAILYQLVSALGGCK